MSDDDKKQGKRDEVGPNGARAIRVSRLMLVNSVRLPVGLAGDNESRDTQVIIAMTTPAGRFEIGYEPWQRHHRVRRYSVDGKNTLEREFCIPESWAAYEPEPATASKL